MKKDVTSVNKALKKFFDAYCPYDEAEYTLYNLEQIELEFIKGGIDEDDPALWILLQDAIEAITNFEF